MNKATLLRAWKQVQAGVVKHSPQILIGLGIAGSATATVLAVRATPKALALIEEERKSKNVEKLTPLEVIKATWKCYIPAAITETASIACLIGANSVNEKRAAALTAAYKLSETALTEYRDAVVKHIGESEEKEVREQVSQTRVEQTPVNTCAVVPTGTGVTILEPVSKRYFKSTEEEVKRIENMLNKQMIHDMFGYASLSDFYDEIGLERTDISDSIGWNVEKGLIDIEFHLARDPEGKPCFALYYNVPPTWDFTKFK